jgi:hypothetical protein
LEEEKKPPILGIYESVIRKIRINWQGDTEKILDHDAKGDKDLGRVAKGSI